MGKEDKVFYDKKIVYLDYLENGEKIKNGGFVKWDVKGEDCRIQIHIRGLYTTDTLQGEIRLISREETYGADRIGLQFGTGEYASHWKNSDLAGTGIPYTECDGILIKLSDSRALKGQWRERASAGEPIPQEKQEMSAELEPIQETVEGMLQAAQSEGEEATEPEAEVAETTEKVSKETETTETIEPTELTVEVAEASEDAETTQTEDAEAGAGEVPETEDVGQPEAVTSNQQRTEDAGQPRAETIRQPETSNYPLSQNKWEQLERIYPKIHPFGDSREYLSVTPRDFVVLPRQYQELVQNSFLLHGYYNYGHLILTRIMEAEEERYYLGVPGAYYDREKQAALMFGFEGFEAGTDKMEDGGFGYYMKRVEI